MRTAFSAPGRGRRCAVTKAITSFGVTSRGSFATTVKNTLRSWVRIVGLREPSASRLVRYRGHCLCPAV